MPGLLVCPRKKGAYFFHLQGNEIHIGRSSINELVLSDPCCSPNHALICRVQEKHIIQDLECKNGTYVNGDRISKRTVFQRNDEITIGTTRLIINCEGQAPPRPKWWPRTVEEAADHILSRLSSEDKRTVRETKQDQLCIFHHGWGTGIRNEFGLWKGNSALLESSGCKHPDDCSMKITERVWEKLQGF